jgi:hypothetical protein
MLLGGVFALEHCLTTAEWKTLLLTPAKPRGLLNTDQTEGYYPHPTQTRLIGQLGPTSHFVPQLSGFMVKSISMQEIFLQFRVPTQALVIDYPGAERLIWNSPEINILIDSREPKFIAIYDDGHNEETMARAFNYRYNKSLFGPWLIFTI